MVLLEFFSSVQNISDLIRDGVTNICTFCQQSIIYFTASSPKIIDWIKDESIQKILQPYAKWHYIERDLAMFNINIDEDYVPCLQGITRASFCSVYLDWIQFCARKRVEVSLRYYFFILVVVVILVLGIGAK